MEWQKHILEVVHGCADEFAQHKLRCSMGRGKIDGQSDRIFMFRPIPQTIGLKFLALY